jgi:methyl-accepting chemotaxis protein
MKWFQNLKVGSKLLMAFLFVAIIAGAVGVVGVINLNSIAQEDTALYTNYTVPLEQMGTVAQAYQRTRVNVRDVLLAKDAAGREYSMKRFDSNIQSMKTGVVKIGATLVSDQGRELYKTLQGAIAEYEPYAESVMQLIAAGKVDEANRQMQTKGVQLAAVIQDTLDKMAATKVDLAEQKAKDNKAAADQAIMLMAILVVAAVALAMALGYFIARAISRPVKEMVNVAAQIAEGDLNVEVAVKSRDELGNLAVAFNSMADNINQAITNISEAAEQVAAGAQHISASGEALSQGATEQASSIEEVTSSVAQVAAQTKENAVNANQANELAVSAKEQASQGNSQMKDMVKAMTDINESSSNISKIIKVIDEIAFQTNILALNAAVEAARAGQHGKGFAVVAEEVRNLAARSANAAKETTAMIEGSIKKVEAGMKIASETASALEGIVQSVAKAADLVGGIAAASNEQATAISQVDQAINQISQVVQTNSATAEESASASEELSSQAEIMKNNVAKFRLKQLHSAQMNSSDFSPEMRAALEAMMGKKKKEAGFESRGPRAASLASKGKIVLDDYEFGKYS